MNWKLPITTHLSGPKILKAPFWQEEAFESSGGVGDEGAFNSCPKKIHYWITTGNPNPSASDPVVIYIIIKGSPFHPEGT